MKKQDLISIRKKEIKDLEKMVAKKRLEAIKATADIKASRDKNLKKAKNSRREIAQILTVIREKQLIQKVDEKPTTPDEVVTESEKRGKQELQQ